VGTLLLTILRIASALSQLTYPSCAFGISASQSVRALRRSVPAHLRARCGIIFADEIHRLVSDLLAIILLRRLQ
jgi:hypothetical protein